MRRQYGTIRKGHNQKQTFARFMVYSLVASDSLTAGKSNRAALFQVCRVTK
jgi:hypothetical protein